MASCSLCRDAIISSAEVSLSLLFLIPFFLLFSSELPRPPCSCGVPGQLCALAGTQHSPRALPSVQHPEPSRAPRMPSLPAGGRWWPRGGPELSEPALSRLKGLSLSKVSRFKSAFLPRPAPATRLRYPCEWRRKRKTQQNLSQMPVLFNIKRLLNSLDVRVSPTKQSF